MAHRIWLLFIVAAIGGTAWLCGVETAAQYGPGQAPPPSLRTEFHRRPRFEIPIATSAVDANAADKEIRLYSSSDRGSTWQRSGTASTKASAFSVNVGADGEYWFAVVLAATNQRDNPNAQYRPSYRAIVDTDPPKVDLQARRTPTGAIVAQWNIRDIHLDRESFQLTAGTPNDMRPVAVDVPRGATDPTTLAGSTSWWPSEGVSEITVRVQVSDRIGNPKSVSSVVHIPADGNTPAGELARSSVHGGRYAPPPSDAPPTITADAPRNPTREASHPQSGDAEARRNIDLPPAGDFAPPATLDPRRRELTGGRQEWNDATAGQTLPRRNEQGPMVYDRRPPLDNPRNAAREELPLQTEVRPPVTGRSEQDNVADRAPAPSEFSETIPPPKNHRTVSESRPARDMEQRPANNVPADNLPAGERPRVLGSRRISLEYDVDSVGPSGIAEVELWSTTDGGRTWQSLGIDADNRSPFVATLAGEGLYGFRLVVRNGNRVGGRAPAAGDLPELWVVVDETKPVAAITSADIRNMDSGREMVIRYEAADARLAARPVSLFYAEKPAGPWQPIAAGLPNSGNHTWPLDRRLVDRVYLRLEVHDEGGNVGAFETANAVLLDESEPVGRIRSVESPRGASVQERWPRYR